MSPGFVVGLEAEARIVRRRFRMVRAGGGTQPGASRAAKALLAEGAGGLVSFGLAGGLDPALRPGRALVPRIVLDDGVPIMADSGLAHAFGGLTDHVILAGQTVIGSCKDKHRLFRDTGAHAVDLESGAVARAATQAGVPFVVVRAICDPAHRILPPVALIALNPNGGISLPGVIASVLRKPGQISGLLALARDAAAGRATLVRLIDSAAEG